MSYTILSRPRMSRAGFAAVLVAHHSPAASSASACYDAFVHAGVDPAVGLAVFQHESSFGLRGRATANRSWGNNRAGGAFIRYPSWAAGAVGAARLLGIYGRNAIRPGTNTSTTTTFPFVWAPASDGNNPVAYGAAITAAVSTWRTRYPVGGVAPVPRPRLTYRVRAGDTLTSIARRLGIAIRLGVPPWRRLYLANRAAIGSNPNVIHVGLVLRWP